MYWWHLNPETEKRCCFVFTVKYFTCCTESGTMKTSKWRFLPRCIETTMDFNYGNNVLSPSCRWGKGWVIFCGPESISLWRKRCITYLIPANYTQAQSLIEAVDIEQPAVVIYFFTILPGKPSQTSVKQRSVSSKSIHPEPWALTSLL